MDELSPSYQRTRAIYGLAALSVAVIVVLGVLTHLRRSVGMVPAQNRRPMSTLNLKLLKGGSWTLADHRGEVIAINYWASWCGPCWEETPVLLRLNRELGPRGLTLVGVAMDERNSDVVPQGVKDFVTNFAIPYAIALTPPMSQVAYAMDGLPTTILVDRGGRIARIYVGAIRERAFQADVESLLEEPVPSP